MSMTHGHESWPWVMVRYNRWLLHKSPCFAVTQNTSWNFRAEQESSRTKPDDLLEKTLHWPGGGHHHWHRDCCKEFFFLKITKNIRVIKLNTILKFNSFSSNCLQNIFISLLGLYFVMNFEFIFQFWFALVNIYTPWPWPNLIHISRFSTTGK